MAMRKRIKKVFNWFYDKYMQRRGYTPYVYYIYNDKYQYAKRSELDSWCDTVNQECKELESVNYEVSPKLHHGIDWKSIRARNKKLEELRKSESNE